MLAVVVTRDGTVPIGGLEAAAECDGRALVVDVDGLRPAELASSLAPRLVDETVVVLPASADGRDLAPRLAAALGRPLLAGAVQVSVGSATVARRGGSVLERRVVDGSFVATLEPGVRGVPADLELPPAAQLERAANAADPHVVEVVTADAADLDLSEASTILAIGAGLADERLVAVAEGVAEALGMSLGATRVVTDWGWLPFERQIGTTGAIVDPEVYVAIAISGAVQHVSGLGEPGFVASVNTDGSCPMAAMAELNLVSDGPSVLVALADRLGVPVDAKVRTLVEERHDG